MIYWQRNTVCRGVATQWNFHPHRTIAKGKRYREDSHRQEYGGDRQLRASNVAPLLGIRHVTHENVSFRRQRHSQPGGDAQRCIEEVVRVRIHVSEREFAVVRRRLQEQHDDEVAHVVDELDAVRDGQRDEERRGDGAQLATSEDDDGQAIADEAEQAEGRIQEEPGDQLGSLIEQAVIAGAATKWRSRRRAVVGHR